MTFKQAVLEMQNGEKVKLPEWVGYWFMQFPDDAVCGKPGILSDFEQYLYVMTKSGDILNTPWVHEYSHRRDWQITSGLLGFEFAVMAIKNGKRIAHNGDHRWYECHEEQVYLCAPEKFAEGAGIVAYLIYPYKFTNKDVFALDYTLCGYKFSKTVVITSVD